MSGITTKSEKHEKTAKRVIDFHRARIHETLSKQEPVDVKKPKAPVVMRQRSPARDVMFPPEPELKGPLTIGMDTDKEILLTISGKGFSKFEFKIIDVLLFSLFVSSKTYF